MPQLAKAGVAYLSVMTRSNKAPVLNPDYSRLAASTCHAVGVSKRIKDKVSQPATGAFSDYANLYLNPPSGFVTGWMYWSKGVLSWPLWVFSLFFPLLITGINFPDMHGFSRIESRFSSIKKIASLFLFIVLGLTVITGVWPRQPAGGNGHGGFLPQGLKGVYTSLLPIVFAYSGISVVPMTATQAEDPCHAIPRAFLGTGLNSFNT